MSNLKSARQAIQAELEHARQGVLFYQMRVAALEEALAKLDSVETVNGRTSNLSKGGGSGKPTGQAKRGRKARSHAAGNGTELPPTGKGFWPNLVTDEPQSAKEILNAAIKALHISPTKESIKKLSQRQTAALNGLVKTKRVGDSGSGRERRFFRLQ
jgi:hypothetical protein